MARFTRRFSHPPFIYLDQPLNLRSAHLANLARNRRSRPNCLLVIRSAPVDSERNILLCRRALQLGRKEHSDIASYVMAVIKELRWLAAAGECGRAATSYRLVTSDKSVRLTVYETILWTCTWLCTILT